MQEIDRKILTVMTYRNQLHADLCSSERAKNDVYVVNKVFLKRARHIFPFSELNYQKNNYFF